MIKARLLKKMDSYKCQSPVLFLVFNRPDLTARVFERIRQVRPAELYIAVDGPRHGRQGEAEAVAQVGDIVKKVDWDCKVETLFRTENLGCAKAIIGAVSWFFEHVDAGIILEDDVLPNPEMFRFFDSTLEYYRDVDAVVDISGFNPLDRFSRRCRRPLLTKYGNIWGWATWADRWRKFSPEYHCGAEVVQAEFNQMLSYYGTRFEACYRKAYHEMIVQRQVDTWDAGYVMYRITSGGHSIMPPVNLVENIGFSADATHTTGSNPFVPPRYDLQLKQLDYIRAGWYDRLSFLFLKKFPRLLNFI